MTRLLDPPAIKQSVVVLACEGCGAEAHATCSCGKPYRPKAQRAAEAIARDPTKSDRAIAAEEGISRATVQRARDQVAPLSHLNGAAPEQRIGRDGKSYTKRRYERPPPAEIRHDLIYEALEPIQKMDAATLKEYERIYAERRSEFGVEPF